MRVVYRYNLDLKILCLGKCKCGAKIYCSIDNSDNSITTVYCSFLNKGDPLVPCKKRQLRGEKREKIGNELGEVII